MYRERHELPKLAPAASWWRRAAWAVRGGERRLQRAKARRTVIFSDRFTSITDAFHNTFGDAGAVVTLDAIRRFPDPNQRILLYRGLVLKFIRPGGRLR